MTVQTLTPRQVIEFLDSPSLAEQWLKQLGIDNTRRAHANLVQIAEAGVTIDLLAKICERMMQELPSISDADMALHNLERFVMASRSPLSLASLFERDSEALPILLQLFSTSQHLSDVLISEPETFDLLRITEGGPVSREILVEELMSEVRVASSRKVGLSLLRRFKRRETARIMYGDIIRSQRLETVTRQISNLAEAICEVTLFLARRELCDRHGTPRDSDGNEAQFVVIALGKLGGQELNYSSDIDLTFLYQGEGRTDGPRSIGNREYFEKLARQFVQLLTESTDQGTCYRVDLRLRPEGTQGPLVNNVSAAQTYYEEKGRTWERQAFVKARPVAGKRKLGEAFLDDLQPWVFRRYLSRADITGIRALKRRIEQRTRNEGGDRSNVKSGHGGIRDIEFTIQFLQLLSGGDLPEIRTGNTLEAIACLEKAGCLTMQERTILEENYAFLRKVEHRLQILFDMQTHSLPSDTEELRKLSVRMGNDPTAIESELELFRSEFAERTTLNRKILDHLLHDAFSDDEAIDPEVDLVLDPDPDTDSIHDVLGKYGFADCGAAYRNLGRLAEETIPFLNTRRCRHFLAAIASRLLTAISRTPDPDATLLKLSDVSDSLGGKGILWELFSSSPASLDLYVRLCAGSPYLSTLLTTNPGMIDELMDSLVLDRLPNRQSIFRALKDRCRGAEDLEPILHSFKNSMHLRVGVRDILGKEDIQATTEALSDVAEACLQQVAQLEFDRLVQRFGIPTCDGAPRQDVEAPLDEGFITASPRSLPDGKRICDLVILGLGKLGGKEPNYHSDLDVIFLYEADGTTHADRQDVETTSNQHFFSELSQRIIRYATRMTSVWSALRDGPAAAAHRQEWRPGDLV